MRENYTISITILDANPVVFIGIIVILSCLMLITEVLDRAIVLRYYFISF